MLALIIVSTIFVFCFVVARHFIKSLLCLVNLVVVMCVLGHPVIAHFGMPRSIMPTHKTCLFYLVGFGRMLLCWLGRLSHRRMLWSLS